MLRSLASALTQCPKYRTRVIGGTLLVMKGLADCATFKRGRESRRFQCTDLEGEWSQDEVHEGLNYARDSGALAEAMRR